MSCIMQASCIAIKTVYDMQQSAKKTGKLNVHLIFFHFKQRLSLSQRRETIWVKGYTEEDEVKSKDGRRLLAPRICGPSCLCFNI